MNAHGKSLSEQSIKALVDAGEVTELRLRDGRKPASSRATATGWSRSALTLSFVYEA